MSLSLIHIWMPAGLDGQGLFRSGIGQLREIVGRHGLDLELDYAALDGGLAGLGIGDLDGSVLHTAFFLLFLFCDLRFDLLAHLIGVVHLAHDLDVYKRQAG